MILQKFFFLWVLLLFSFQSLCTLPLAEQFKQVGYLEICDKKHGAATFDSLYAYFDELIESLQTNPRQWYWLICKYRFKCTTGRLSLAWHFRRIFV